MGRRLERRGPRVIEEVTINGRNTIRVWRRLLIVEDGISMGQYTRQHGSDSGENAKGRWAAGDSELEKKFPALTEFLCEQKDEEGHPRVTSTILLSAEDGLWKVCLTDRCQVGGKFDYKLWRSAPTLFGAFAACEKALVEATADWRKFPKWTKGDKR